MKSQEGMSLYRNSSNSQKWNYGKLKLLFLVLYFASICSMTSGAYPTKPRFAIKNKHCGKYIHPIGGWGTIPQDDPLFLWQGVHSGTHYQFDPVEGKWGYIRQVNSGKVWHPKGGKGKFGDRLVLHSDRHTGALFAIDQAHGWIQHRYGLYVHMTGYNSCDNGNRLGLYDDTHSRMEWEFVDPYKTSEEVLPYGSFKSFGDWQLVFALHNSMVTHIYQITHKTGRSETKSNRNQLTFGWQVSASAKIWFARVSTTLSFKAEIERSSSSAWASEKTETHTIKVVAGQSIAAWQRILTGEQLGNREVFQSNFFEYTKSRYEKPPHDTRRTSMITSRRFGSRVYYYYLNDTDTVDVHLNESQDRNLHRSQESMFIIPQKFENTNEDRAIPMKNATEDNDYDENGVFSLYPYAIVDDDVTDQEENAQTNSVDRNSNEHVFEDTKIDESIPMTKTTEDIDYDENGVFALYPYAIVDDDDAEKQDE